MTQDKDYGVSMMSGISAAEAIELYTKVLPGCINKAKENSNVNDAAYFETLLEKYRPIIIEKVKNADQLWIAYCDTTGYPYMVDGDMIALYDYNVHEDVEEQLAGSGFELAFQNVDPIHFKNEVGHMYRNGYHNIRFIDGKGEPFTVSRDELYDYEEFFNAEYMTNPGLQSAMIDFFQEIRKRVQIGKREGLLKKREDIMIEALRNAEYMVPCIKEENDDQIEISHPFIDLTDRVEEKAEGEKVIAVPVFTDGFELDKCYQGHHENMLYKLNELYDLIEELGASGMLINCLGISYYLNKDQVKKIK